MTTTTTTKNMKYNDDDDGERKKERKNVPKRKQEPYIIWFCSMCIWCLYRNVFGYSENSVYGIHYLLV